MAVQIRSIFIKWVKNKFSFLIHDWLMVCFSQLNVRKTTPFSHRNVPVLIVADIIQSKLAKKLRNYQYFKSSCVICIVIFVLISFWIEYC